MATSDLSVLLEMGFEEERAHMAVKQTGGLQGALEWLEENQDKLLEDIKAPATNVKDRDDDPNELPPNLLEGEVAKSLVCNECGKKFRSHAQAEFHASKTLEPPRFHGALLEAADVNVYQREHTDFSESTEEIPQLTKEEQKEKLEALRKAAAERRAKQTIIDKEEAKKNEKIRMKSTQEVQHIKEELAKKEQIKEAAAKRQEKIADLAVKKRIQEKIAADKEERRLKAERIKAEREGRAIPAETAPAATPLANKPPAAHTEARLRLQIPGGNLQKTFPVETTLFEVAQALEAENGAPVRSFTLTYPKKVFEGSVDFGMTLKEAGLVPSAVLIVK